MRIHLDSGAVTAFAGDPAIIAGLRRRGDVPHVCAAVLTECLTGDHRRDFTVNRFLKVCHIREVDETLGRVAAGLRSQTRRAGVSAVDALVVALAARDGAATVFTSDPADLNALVAQTHEVRIATA